MRILEEILVDYLTQWDRNYLGDVVYPILKELAGDARFDEITLVMQSFKKQYGLALSSVETRVAPIILNHYIYPVAGIDEYTIHDRWGSENMAATINRAVLREGLLAMTVERVVEQLRQKKSA
ncbi:hypothetical protein ACIPL1_27560 [Pseudomonas sp. NPDC090202]|uniref:hypothetical protein n=1 Tax=unclassified Pseudomonas TaxID=196821 RepID=UPI00381C95E9